MKYIALLFMASLCLETLSAQDASSFDDDYSPESSYVTIDAADVSQRNGYAEAPIAIRKFDRTKWKEVIGNETYSEQPLTPKRKQEVQNSEGTGSAEPKRRRPIMNDEGDASPDASSSEPFDIPMLNVIVYVLAIGIIGYILFLVIKNTSLKSNASISKPGIQDQANHIEDIRELEVDRLLRESLASGNYRLAIRIYFLGLLKQLNEDGCIVWKKNKTNRDYLAELFTKAYHFQEIKSLTLAYEQVWYGDHDFSAQTYQQIISSFRAIEQKIKAAKVP